MKQILFLATISTLLISSVWAQKSVCPIKKVDCLIHQHSNSIKAKPADASLKRGVTYLAKDNRVFFDLEAASYALPKVIIAKQAAISKDENFDTLTEEFSFLIQDFKMNHQSEINNLNIKIRYGYEKGILESKYPDFRAIAKDIEAFLNNYPNKVDYWEILNRKLTFLVLKKYPMLSSITSEIQVSPTQSVSYLRSSIVTRHQSKSVRTK